MQSLPNPDDEEEKAGREGCDGVGVWAHHLNECAIAAVVYDGDIRKTLLRTFLTLGTPIPILKKAVRENIGMYFKVSLSFSVAVFPFSRFSGLPMRYSWQNEIQDMR